jgi:hypothetical protein
LHQRESAEYREIIRAIILLAEFLRWLWAASMISQRIVFRIARSTTMDLLFQLFAGI